MRGRCWVLALSLSPALALGFQSPPPPPRATSYAGIGRRRPPLSALPPDTESDLEIARKAALLEDRDWYMRFIGSEEAEGVAGEQVPETNAQRGEGDVPPKRTPREAAAEQLASQESVEELGMGTDGISRSSRGKDFMGAKESAEEGNARRSALALLGYDAREADSLDPDVVELVLSKKIMRPADGIPEDWLVTGSGGFEEDRWYDYEEEEEDYGVADEFEFKALPRDTPKRLRRAAGYDFQFDDGDDDDDVLGGNIQPLALPTLQNFKDMLRKESEMRLWVSGPDMADALATENRVRINAYKLLLDSVDGEAEWGADEGEPSGGRVASPRSGSSSSGQARRDDGRYRQSAPKSKGGLFNVIADAVNEFKELLDDTERQAEEWEWKKGRIPPPIRSRKDKGRYYYDDDDFEISGDAGGNNGRTSKKAKQRALRPPSARNRRRKTFEKFDDDKEDFA